LVRRVDGRGRDREDPGPKDDDRREERHADEQLVAGRLAPLATADRPDDRPARGACGQDGHDAAPFSASSYAWTTLRYTSSSDARRSVTNATSAPAATSSRTSTGSVRRGSSVRTRIDPFSSHASRTPWTARTRSRCSGRGDG